MSTKSKQIKARLMLAMVDPRFYVLNRGDKPLKKRSSRDTAPDYHIVAVLDISDPEALVEQVADVKYPKTRLAGAGYVMDIKSVGHEVARAVLESLGIIPKPRVAKRRKSRHPVEFENAELGEEG